MIKVQEKGEKKKKTLKRGRDKGLGYNSIQIEKDFENKGMFIYMHQQC